MAFELCQPLPTMPVGGFRRHKTKGVGLAATCSGDLVLDRAAFGYRDKISQLLNLLGESKGVISVKSSCISRFEETPSFE